jgi:hypothetical protein
MERAALVGMAYHEGKTVGVRVGNIEKCDVASVLGLNQNDIIITIQDVSLVDLKDRMKAYDTVIGAKVGDVLKIGVKRAGKDIVLSYTLAKIEKAKKPIIGLPTKAPDAQQQGAGDQPLKMNRLQEREQMSRDFSQQQNVQQRDQTAIMEIRRRLLENLQARLKNARTR